MGKTEPLTAGTDVPTRPLKAEEFPNWVHEEAEDKEITDEPADTRDLDSTAVVSKTSELETDDGDTGPLPTPVVVPRVESAHLLTDLDITEEGMSKPEDKIGDPFFDESVGQTSTPPFRRPTIDTAKLIPTLLRRAPSGTDQLQPNLTIDDFLKCG